MSLELKHQDKEELIREIKVLKAELAVLKEIELKKIKAEKETKLLLEITNIISKSDNLNDSLRLVLKEICDFTQWAFGQVWFPHHSFNILECGPWYSNVPNGELFRKCSESYSGKSECLKLLNNVVNKKIPIWYKETYLLDKNQFFRSAVATEIGFKAALQIPILFKDETLAVFEFFMFDPKEEDTKYVDIISSLALQLSSLIKRKKIEHSFIEHRKIMEMIALGKNLSEILNLICTSVENISLNSKCSILLLNNDSLTSAAAPSLPEDYINAINGTKIGPEVGSCGTAAHRKETVIVDDIENDPLWKNFKDLALKHNLKSCWSSPIISLKGEVLGTFAIYHSEISSPSKLDFKLIESLTHLAMIAIEQLKTREELKLLNENLEKIVDDRTKELVLINKKLQVEISIRKKIEKDLQFFKNLVNQSNDALFIINPTLGKILDINDQACHMLGYERNELIGKKVIDIDLIINTEEIWKETIDKIKSEGSKILESTLKKKDNSELISEISTKYLLLENKKEYLIAIVRDITVRKLIENKLKESEEKFREFAENSKEVFWIIDLTSQKIIYVNKAYETVWGRPVESLYNNQFDWITSIHPDDLNKVRKLFDEGAAKGIFNIEYRIINSDNSVRWIHDRGFPIKDENGNVYRIAGIAEDITYRINLEKDLKTLKQKENQANEIRSLEKIVTLCTSDPMTKLFGFNSIKKSLPNVFNELVLRFEKLIVSELENKTNNISEELKFIAKQLVFLKAVPSDILEIHSTILKNKIPLHNAEYIDKITIISRNMILELMGYLASYYRNTSMNLKRVPVIEIENKKGG